MPKKYLPEDLAKKYTTEAQKRTRVKKLHEMISHLRGEIHKREIMIRCHFKEIGIHNKKEEEVVWNPQNRRYE
jgi:thiaminase